MNPSILDMTIRAIAAARIVWRILNMQIPEMMNGVPSPEGPAFRVPLPDGYSLSISFLTQGNLPEVALYYEEALTSRPEWEYGDSGSHPIGDGVSLTSSNTIARLICEIWRVEDLIILSN